MKTWRAAPRFLILQSAKDQIMTKPVNDPTTLSIDAQVAWLMQGTNYGDEETKRQMTRELRERLSESQRTGKSLRVYCGYDPVSYTHLDVYKRQAIR